MTKDTAANLFNQSGKALINRILLETKQTTAWLAGMIRCHQASLDAIVAGRATFSRTMLIKIAVFVDHHPVDLLALSDEAIVAIKALVA